MKRTNRGSLKTNRSGKMLSDHEKYIERVGPPNYLLDQRNIAKNNQLMLLRQKHPRCEDNSHIAKRHFEYELWEGVWNAAVHNTDYELNEEERRLIAKQMVEFSKVLLFKEHFSYYSGFFDPCFKIVKSTDGDDKAPLSDLQMMTLPCNRKFLSDNHPLRILGNEPSVKLVANDESDEDESDEDKSDEDVPDLVPFQLKDFYDGGPLFFRKNDVPF